MIAVGLALFAQTWLFVGVMGAPIGYTLDVPISTLTHTEFMLAGPPEQLGPARSLKVRFGGFDLQEDWTTSSGEGVRVVERMAPYAVLIGGEPSFDDVLAAVGDRSRWRETTVRDGRVNALQARIGRIAISIEGNLSYDDLFKIAQSLRPGFAPLL